MSEFSENLEHLAEAIPDMPWLKKVTKPALPAKPAPSPVKQAMTHLKQVPPVQGDQGYEFIEWIDTGDDQQAVVRNTDTGKKEIYSHVPGGVNGWHLEIDGEDYEFFSDDKKQYPELAEDLTVVPPVSGPGAVGKGASEYKPDKGEKKLKCPECGSTDINPCAFKDPVHLCKCRKCNHTWKVGDPSLLGHSKLVNGSMVESATDQAVVHMLQRIWNGIGPDVFAASGEREMSGKDVQEIVMDADRVLTLGKEYDREAANTFLKSDRETQQLYLDAAFPPTERFTESKEVGEDVRGTMEAVLAIEPAEGSGKRVDEISARKKSYYEIQLKELVDFAGGEEALKAKFKTSEDCYEFLEEKHDELIHQKLAQYEEVGELSNTVIGDWCDNRFESKPKHVQGGLFYVGVHPELVDKLDAAMKEAGLGEVKSINQHVGDIVWLRVTAGKVDPEGLIDAIKKLPGFEGADVRASGVPVGEAVYKVGGKMDIICPYCGETDLTKTQPADGGYKYLCRNCQKTFVSIDAPKAGEDVRKQRTSLLASKTNESRVDEAEKSRKLRSKESLAKSYAKKGEVVKGMAQAVGTLQPDLGDYRGFRPADVEAVKKALSPIGTKAIRGTTGYAYTPENEELTKWHASDGSPLNASLGTVVFHYALDPLEIEDLVYVEDFIERHIVPSPKGQAEFELGQMRGESKMSEARPPAGTGFKADRLPREEALKRFEAMKQILVDLGLDANKIEPGGSIRRLKPTVGDMDIALFQPEKVDKDFYGKFVEKLKTLFKEVIVRQMGESQLSVNCDGFLYEFKKAPMASYGAMMMHITGSGDYNMGIRAWVKARGMKLNQYELADAKTGEHFDSTSEEAIFNKLGIPYVEPKDRIQFIPPTVKGPALEPPSTESTIPKAIYDKVPADVKEKLKTFQVPPVDDNGVRVPADVLWNKMSRQRYHISTSLWKKAHPDAPSKPLVIPDDLKLDRY